MKVSATVTLPSMELSNNTLDYGTVVCGQCKIITVRLYNTQQVKLVKQKLTTCIIIIVIIVKQQQQQQQQQQHY